MARNMRGALVGVGVLALLGVHAPQPLYASTAGTVAFIWQITIGTTNDGLASPCFTSLPGAFGVPQIDLSLCITVSTLLTGSTPHAVTVKPAPRAKHPADIMVNLQFDRALAPVTFASIACLGTAVNVSKLTKPDTETGLCAFGGAGVISGHCEFSTGRIAGAFANANNVYGFELKYTIVAGKVLFNGNIALQSGNVSQGWVRGMANMTADSSTGSCTNKHPLAFFATGQATFLLLNPL